MKELDEPMTAEEEAFVASLSPVTIERIDAALLAYAKPQGSKVALLVVMAMTDPALGDLGLPDVYYAGRIRRLVELGLLVSEGDLGRMRHSEVRLP